MGRVKRKSAFEHAQNVQIHIILCMGKISSRAQLFKTNDVISYCIIKTLIIKYGTYANIFAEKMWVAFAFAKATHIFSAKIPEN